MDKGLILASAAAITKIVMFEFEVAPAPSGRMRSTDLASRRLRSTLARPIWQGGNKTAAITRDVMFEKMVHVGRIKGPSQSIPLTPTKEQTIDRLVRCSS